MLCLLFLDNWLILFNSCSYCTNVDSYCRTRNTEKTTNEANVEIEKQSLTAKIKTRKVSK